MILDSEAEPVGDQLELVFHKLTKKFLKKIVYLIIINNHKISCVMETGLMIFMQKS
jgi:hypothetical protein